MKNRLLSLIVVLAAVLGAACGGGNPNKPEPVCTDPNAQNVGGPLPCIPKPVVVATNVSFVTSNPKAYNGSNKEEATLQTTVLEGGTEGSPVSGDWLEVTLKHEISPEHLAEAQRRGARIEVRTFLSVDGVNNIPGGVSARIWVPTGVATGEGKHKFVVVAVMSPNVTQTNYVLVRFGWVPEGAPNQTEVFFTKAVPATYFWNTPK